MQRICGTLADNGFEVILTGRKLKDSKELSSQPFQQKRIQCAFNSGFVFYAEYNLRLFLWLLFQKADAICAIDLDTIIPCLLASYLKGCKRIYDAHELFTEQKEIVTRPSVHKFWLSVEKFAVPKYRLGYTVNNFIVEELNRRYGVNYAIVRNLPVLITLAPAGRKQEQPFIIYQGAVNEGRSFETLIPAMKMVNAKLIIFGKGNFFEQTKQLIKENNLHDKVELKGYVEPAALRQLTPAAHIAITIFEQTGLNQFYSLSNRFFDYIMAGVPQVCVNYPEYKLINDQYNVALMIGDTMSETIAFAINKLLDDAALHEQLRNNCVKAREQLNWGSEEKRLLAFYQDNL